MAVSDPRQAVLQKALTWPDRARATVVDTDDAYVAAAELLKGIKALLDEADQAFDPIIKDAERAVATAKAKKADVRTPLIQAERIIKDHLVDYKELKARRAREQQRRREEEERLRADAEALERAAALEKEGKGWGDVGLVQQAEQIVEEQIQAPAPSVPVVPPRPPRVAGIVHRMTWTGSCVDLRAFVAHCAAHPEHAHALRLREVATSDLQLIKHCLAQPELRHLLDARQMTINEMARAMREGLNRIPGLRAFETPDVAARR
jgi:hypothetical protein